MPPISPRAGFQGFDLAPWVVLVHARIATVGNGHRDRLVTLGREQLKRLVGLPLAGERGALIEDVLAVVKVEHRIAPPGARVDSVRTGQRRWQVNEDLRAALERRATQRLRYEDGAADRVVGAVDLGVGAPLGQ